MVRLAASMVVRNELNRYLKPCIEHLLSFCDVIAVVDDSSDDGTCEYLCDLDDRVVLDAGKWNEPTFYTHEGEIRQYLLQHTFAQNPTHVLHIDADEFISDGHQLRERLSHGGPVWTLQMTEIWGADKNGLKVRVDRQWKPRPVPILYQVPPNPNDLRIMDRALACGREPVEIRRHRNPDRLEIEILHFGWANASERKQRYARYQQHDGGQFHANAHLLSIMDGREHLKNHPWPSGLAAWKSKILKQT